MILFTVVTVQTVFKLTGHIFNVELLNKASADFILLEKQIVTEVLLFDLEIILGNTGQVLRHTTIPGGGGSHVKGAGMIVEQLELNP